MLQKCLRWVQNVLFYAKNSITVINAACSWTNYLKLFLSTSTREGVELERMGVGWGEAEDLEPKCQLFQIAVRPCMKIYLILHVSGVWGFRQRETWSETHLLLIIWEVKGGEGTLAAKAEVGAGTAMPCVAPCPPMDHMWRWNLGV